MAKNGEEAAADKTNRIIAMDCFTPKRDDVSIETDAIFQTLGKLTAISSPKVNYILF